MAGIKCFEPTCPGKLGPVHDDALWICHKCGRSFASKQVRDREVEENRQRRQAAEAEWTAAYNSLTERDREILKVLDEMINKIGETGADVSYFPHRAQMALIETAKELAKKLS